MSKDTEKWAIVQHSGFGYSEDPTFRQGLEPKLVTKVTEQRLVEQAGGLLFDGYNEAEDFCDTAMYPPGALGLVPQARGTFSDKEIAGLKIYVPVRTVVG